jgi:hypothetical protein
MPASRYKHALYQHLTPEALRAKSALHTPKQSSLARSQHVCSGSTPGRPQAPAAISMYVYLSGGGASSKCHRQVFLVQRRRQAGTRAGYKTSRGGMLAAHEVEHGRGRWVLSQPANRVGNSRGEGGGGHSLLVRLGEHVVRVGTAVEYVDARVVAELRKYWALF